MKNSKLILGLAISLILANTSYADTNTTESASQVSPKELTIEKPAEQTSNKELPIIDAEKYDPKYKGLLQLLNQAELSEGEYLGIKRIVETGKEYPALETGILYFTKFHDTEDQDYKKAIYWLGTSSIEEKNSTADLLLGSLYIDGKGVEKNFATALSFYERAAERNNESAKLILAGTYLFNTSAINKEKGQKWLNELVKSNNKYAILLNNLMNLDENKKDIYKEFLDPYFNYAKDGDEMAQFTLGYLYFSGKILNKDIETASEYLKQSSIKGNPISIILFQETLKELKNDQK